MKGFGGILSFMLKENCLEAIGRFIPQLRFTQAAGRGGNDRRSTGNQQPREMLAGGTRPAGNP